MSGTGIRPARAADIGHLQEVENAADVLLTGALHPTEWEPAPHGSERAATSGFVLVAAGSAAGSVPVGFVHVREAGALAHLEQLSVLPEHGRQGVGRALVEAAKHEALTRGHQRITLRTYADLPWNAPSYSSCGFVESEPDSLFLLDLVQIERRSGLQRYGRRIQMTAELTEPVSGHAGPVIPA